MDYAAVRSGPSDRLRITADTASSAKCGAPHIAEFERDLIQVRTGEGRERAKARGVKMGRKPKLTPHQQREAIKRREQGEPLRDIASSYNVSHPTISRLQEQAAA
ncbi:MAG TPA: recombinase family protein [Acetobacteraceae bacterium]|nr:recombinase family protein [Acetobacteraceae bacterium]